MHSLELALTVATIQLLGREKLGGSLDIVALTIFFLPQGPSSNSPLVLASNAEVKISILDSEGNRYVLMCRGKVPFVASNIIFNLFLGECDMGVK